jgi:exosortase
MFALALLWARRSKMPAKEVRPSANGLAMMGMGAIVLLSGGCFCQDTIDGLALPVFLAGVVMVLGGWPALRWSWPSIIFLVFMIPLPWTVENAVGPPLQSLATLASTFSLQSLGFLAFSEGNVIQMSDAKIGVVEACSGLSMLISFFALAVGMALVIARPLLDKIVLVLSAIPVALLANIARITFTGVLHEMIGGTIADKFYHDMAGWVMIPFALVLYWCEIWILSQILVEVEAMPVLAPISGGARSATTNSLGSSPCTHRSSRGARFHAAE